MPYRAFVLAFVAASLVTASLAAVDARTTVALRATRATSTRYATPARTLAALERVRAFDAVAVSPDGRRVAWAASAAIFVADVAHPRRARRIGDCRSAPCADASLAWSPDSTRLLFLRSTAQGQAQLAIATVATGRVRLVTTTLRGPVGSPTWSHDGTELAFLYTANAPKLPNPLYAMARAHGVLGSRYYEQRLATVPAAGGAVRLLSPANLYVYEYDRSPDGTTFVASAAHGDGDAQWWVAALYAIDARSGRAKKIHDPALQIASPRYSRDGKQIAYIGGLMSDQSITGGDVYLLASGGGAAVDVTPGLRASVVTLAWTSPATLIVTELAGGAMAVATVDVVTKTQRTRWRADETIYADTIGDAIPGTTGISLSRDGSVSAAIRQSFTRAPEIYLGAIGAWRRITAANASTPHVIARARNLSWRSDAFAVQGWLVYPANYDPERRYPMVVIAHGGPAYANYPAFPSGPSAYDAVLASQGYFVLEPNPRGSYGRGEAFTRANVRDFGGGDLRDILAGVDAAERVAPIDDARIGIYGHSYGGYMTMWAVTQTDRFHAAVSGAGLANWQSYYGTNDINTWMIPYFGATVYADPAVYAKSSPIDFVTHAKTPTLLYSGDRDAEVPISQSYEFWNALKTLGVPTEFVVYPDEGHLFVNAADRADIAARMLRWFETYLK